MKQILIVIVMAAQIAQSAQDPTKLLKSIQETQRHYHIADLSSLTDGSVYLMINGGFSGAFFEFADLTENERFSITIGKSLSQGGESFKKAIRYPFTDAFHDPSIEDLRLSIRKLIAAKLPSEVDHISTTDSREIFVAEKRKGELFYWARETGGTEMEPEFFELFQKAKATEKLVEPTAPRVEPSPAVPVPGRGSAA